MAYVYSDRFRAPRWVTAPERGFYRLMGTDPSQEQDWKSYAKVALVFMAVFAVLLYVLLRLQEHLPLNPDSLPAVSPHIAMNTTASFVTNTNWQYYGGEFTMSYLSQMTGLAVQNFVSAGIGMAVLVAVDPRLLAPLDQQLLGNFWVDLYRSIAYILLPLAVVLAVILDLPGRRRRRSSGARHRHDARGRDPDDRARPGCVADRDQAARHERRRLLQLELRPCRSRTRTASRTSSRCSRSC